MHRLGVAVVLAALAFPLLAMGQTTPKVVKTSAMPSSTLSGKDLFLQYCTPCHGVSGKGDGPAASAMRVRPADLTRLAAKYNGTFPDMEVGEALRAGPTPTTNSNVHGSETMPVWGPVFRALSSGDTGRTELRIHNLVKYIGSIQER
jgi:mono/diheme cytochrome c family protein